MNTECVAEYYRINRDYAVKKQGREIYLMKKYDLNPEENNQPQATKHNFLIEKFIGECEEGEGAGYWAVEMELRKMFPFETVEDVIEGLRGEIEGETEKTEEERLAEAERLHQEILMATETEAVEGELVTEEQAEKMARCIEELGGFNTELVQEAKKISAALLHHIRTGNSNSAITSQ